MWAFLFVTFFILLMVALMVAVARRHNNMYDDFNDEEVVTHTTVTTTTTTQQDPTPAASGVPVTAGTITRGWEDNKPYVFDPVDNSKMFLKESDDLYEDADGKIWNLI